MTAGLTPNEFRDIMKEVARQTPNTRWLPPGEKPAMADDPGDVLIPFDDGNWLIPHPMIGAFLTVLMENAFRLSSEKLTEQLRRHGISL